jgi:amino acid transporter
MDLKRKSFQEGKGEKISTIFVLVGPAIGRAGSAVIIAFIINGIITLFTAMAYAELGSAMPEAGGGYLWVREGLPGSVLKSIGVLNANPIATNLLYVVA